jgi:hypothetical protein
MVQPRGNRIALPLRASRGSSPLPDTSPQSGLPAPTLRAKAATIMNLDEATLFARLASAAKARGESNSKIARRARTISSAVKILQPDDGGKCRRDIAYWIICTWGWEPLSTGSVAEVEKELNSAIENVKKVKQSLVRLRRLGGIGSYPLTKDAMVIKFHILDDTEKDLQYIVDEYAEIPRPRGRGRHGEVIKRLAAQGAYSFVKDYAKQRPTSSQSGLYYRFASILYEALTNNANVDLEHHCHAHLVERGLAKRRQPREKPLRKFG